jgi:Amt family ammonium transporter
MYQAKERGRGRVEVYDDVMRARATDRLRVENDLRRALSEDELRVHYQPIVSLASGRVVGMEALARWQHPERGLLGPAEFIAVAEENGSIVEIGKLVLDTACRQAAAWHAARPDDAPVAISVNLSLRQVAHSDLPLMVQRALHVSGLDPQLLNLEITESVLMDDPEAVMQTLARLRDLGVGLVLDDFGTGYSSLAYVKRFPIGVLKVDRSFISDLGREGHDATIVAAVINMARGLRIEVVAEGVETGEQAALLRALGCELAQGYLYSRPVPASRAAKLLDVSFAPAPPAEVRSD